MAGPGACPLPLHIVQRGRVQLDVLFISVRVLAVLNWEYQLMHVDPYNGCKAIVVVCHKSLDVLLPAVVNLPVCFAKVIYLLSHVTRQRRTCHSVCSDVQFLVFVSSVTVTVLQFRFG